MSQEMIEARNRIMYSVDECGVPGPDIIDTELAKAVEAGRAAYAAELREAGVVRAMTFDGTRESIEAICAAVNVGTDEPVVQYEFFGPDDMRNAMAMTDSGDVALVPGSVVVVIEREASRV